mmetsp:Transcript_35051/g.55846  ORF Transcript_35051/g.55846 Transcript_35051/m.55846 type:complete len:106 (+) Transcript_35051:248-565(+)
MLRWIDVQKVPHMRAAVGADDEIQRRKIAALWGATAEASKSSNESDEFPEDVRTKSLVVYRSYVLDDFDAINNEIDAMPRRTPNAFMPSTNSIMPGVVVNTASLS